MDKSLQELLLYNNERDNRVNKHVWGINNLTLTETSYYLIETDAVDVVHDSCIS